MPRAITLGAPRIFGVKMGRGDLGSKNKKFCIIELTNILKKFKKVVTEKNLKSKKPKKYAQNGRFFTPEGQF